MPSITSYCLLCSQADLGVTTHVEHGPKFTKGNNVKVIQGDLKHLTGVVLSVVDDNVVVLPAHEVYLHVPSATRLFLKPFPGSARTDYVPSEGPEEIFQTG